MDKKEARRLGEIMVAWADGKPVEYKNMQGKWCAASEHKMGFIFSGFEYRMASEFRTVSEMVSELGDSIIGQHVETMSGLTFPVVEITRTSKLVCIDDRTGMIALLNPEIKIKIID